MICEHIPIFIKSLWAVYSEVLHVTERLKKEQNYYDLRFFAAILFLLGHLMI